MWSVMSARPSKLSPLDQGAALLEFVDFAEFMLKILQVRFRIQALPCGSFEQIQRFVLRSVPVDVLL